MPLKKCLNWPALVNSRSCALKRKTSATVDGSRVLGALLSDSDMDLGKIEGDLCEKVGDTD